jgi:hypothetical protein
MVIWPPSSFDVGPYLLILSVLGGHFYYSSKDTHSVNKDMHHEVYIEATPTTQGERVNAVTKEEINDILKSSLDLCANPCPDTCPETKCVEKVDINLTCSIFCGVILCGITLACTLTCKIWSGRKRSATFYNQDTSSSKGVKSDDSGEVFIPTSRRK